MRQPNLRGFPAFADAPVDMPYAVVAGFKSEAAVVQSCIDFARETRGVSQRQVALMCGWRSDSYLSEIAKEDNEKRMPPKKLERFALATGTRLLSQWLERQETDRHVTGRATQADRRKLAVAAMRAHAEAVAA
jgi:transcriptional regulator with XRE-family HTH domain